MTNDYWAEVQVVAKRDIETHLFVPSVAEGSPARAAGLRDKDEILAIDGVEVKTLSAGEALWRLSGAPGSEVKLLVLHRKEKEPVPLTLRRVELPKPNPK